MIFETERLILRPWNEEDAESLYEYAKDPLVGPIAGWPVHTSVDCSREIIKNVLAVEGTYAVCLKEDNRAIGSVGLIPPAQTHTVISENEIEVGYWIGVPFWGQVLIPEAVRKIQEHVFVDLGCTAMWCGYYDGNIKSKKCQEKCGFVYHHTEENKPCVVMGDVRTEHFTRITKEEWMKRTDAVLYVHGKDGTADEAKDYEKFFPDAYVYGFDYKAQNPWEAKNEFIEAAKELSEKYNRVILVAESIGAYFSMNAGIDKYVDRAYFISPIVNLERLIMNMIGWANTTEEELERRGIIPVEFGEDLSWEYLSYVRENRISWSTPTEILYGSLDNLQSLDTIEEFVNRTSAGLTVMEGGEHWFHTKEQMDFFDEWLNKVK